MLAVATTKQMISLTLEHQKRIEENDQFKEYEPKVITYEYYTKLQGEKKNTKNNNCENPEWRVALLP